ncbi:MurR/RpiR family transcriptional regulator [Clostridium tertium]|jgi:DNA-binding MurR/RpiR family transcriptional regulator|uniref:MurR/RpiR family transcriptional regulator n=1 Tax=Clostridium TaxID=1485 RepID=UPI001159CDE5|nr:MULTISPECIES: MurR/RpiR family transcriptional regulator [Clostridium]MBP1867343.1 DNA-binding MurR/RpiR family transcriptional regulator [Clostridium tertium]MBS5307576.1 MurR/RpiR family transcriptional regulator [Clostridium sp.]MDB1923138.1 MurR/RpiR family transcriptional regulator [Clostridium tertium]MDB1926720.1 MurR/RpiR family transcriptional regulator [Clostridium tertium]MDB1931243.1 MurR/RpiR family transcriptional regulator [Clostridium tertium]
MKFDIYKIADNYKLTETERQILEYILKNIDNVLDKGVREVAQANYTSATTIIKLSKKLGYTGYVDMLYRLNFIIKNNEKNQERTSDITSFIDEIDKSTIDSFIDNLIKHRQDIIYITGTGFSSPIVDFFCRKMLVLGFKCIKTNSYGVYDNNQIGGALVIGISKSGETESVTKVIDYAAKNKLDIITFTGRPNSHMAKQSTIHFSILDDKELDDRNITSNYFYARVMIVMEYLLDKAMNSL